MAIGESSERCAVLLLAVTLDLLAGELPNRWHPVAWLGTLAGRFERLAPSSGRGVRLVYGAGLTMLLVSGSAGLGSSIARRLRPSPTVARLAASTALLKCMLSVRALAWAALAVKRALEQGELDAARQGLHALVSRPSSGLSEPQVAAAAIESLAENLSDSVVAPALYYLLFGLPGALVYRTANTLDAMIGYHGHYEELGKFAARLDDLLNLVPARLSAALLIIAAAPCGESFTRALRTMRSDSNHTESPNAGWPMSAAAGALGLQLEKVGSYRLGAAFPPPRSSDIDRAVRLFAVAVGLALGLLLMATACRPGARR